MKSKSYYYAIYGWMTVGIILILNGIWNFAAPDQWCWLSWWRASISFVVGLLLVGSAGQVLEDDNKDDK